MVDVAHPVVPAMSVTLEVQPLNMDPASTSPFNSNVNSLLNAANQLSSSLYLNFSSPAARTSYTNQLYILSALLGLGLVLQLLSLLLRWKNGCLWICRRSGSYIVLNGTVAYTFWSSIYLGVCVAFRNEASEN